MKKDMLAFIGMIIGLIIILATFFLPWYSTQVSGGGQEMNSDMYLDRTEMEFMGSKITQSNEGIAFLNNTLYFIILTFIMTILALIGVIGFYYNLGNRDNMRKIGVIFGITTFIIAISSIFYFMIVALNQMQEARSMYFSTSGAEDTLPDISFWWSTEINGTQLSAGPGYAWYFMIIAGIIVLISAVLLYKCRASETQKVMQTSLPPTE